MTDPADCLSLYPSLNSVAKSHNYIFSNTISMTAERQKIEVFKLFLLVCTSQFSSAVVLALIDAHHQHDLNLVIGDHRVTQYW